MSTPSDAIAALIAQHVPEHEMDEPTRNESAKRFAKAFAEMTSGYAIDVPSLFRLFDGPADQIVAVRGIRFASTCEHHLLPFFGEANIAYLPGTKLVGLSKLARVVEAYARRLQMQERLTSQIADAIDRYANAKGSACVIFARHTCLACRGAKQLDAEMRTSVMTGVFKQSDVARAEVFNLLSL